MTLTQRKPLKLKKSGISVADALYFQKKQPKNHEF